MQARLIEIASNARTFIQPLWREWHAAWNTMQPVTDSQYTCARTSLFLVKALRHEGIEATWQSGIPRLSPEGPELGAYGFLVEGRWESHAWVQTSGWIIDITADQFGAEPVIVTAAGDYRYKPGEGEAALPPHTQDRQRAVDAIWPLWLSYRTARAPIIHTTVH